MTLDELFKAALEAYKARTTAIEAQTAAVKSQTAVLVEQVSVLKAHNGTAEQIRADISSAIAEAMKSLADVRLANIALAAVEKPVEKAAETPAEKQAEKASEPAQIKASTPAEKPVENPTEAPAPKPEEKPAEPVQDKAETPAPKPLDREAVKDLCARVAEKHGPQAVIGSLAQLGFSRLTKMPDEKLPELFAILEKKLAE